MKIIIAIGLAAAAAIAVPAFAQAAPMASSLPKCSATVRDSCDQSKTTERYALTAEQADKTGGVGDRHGGMGMGMKTDGGMAGKPMMHKHMMHKHMRHHMMHKSTTTTTTPAAQ